MNPSELKTHWENIYKNKKLEDVSWYQPIPETSLKFIQEFNVQKNAAIIDVGGGDSFLADHLLGLGFTDITVLDISEEAIHRAKKRLGINANKINWIVANASNFVPPKKYDFWHDRAAFHFLTNEKHIDSYLETASTHLTTNGVMVLGTFSESGPMKCSGIEIKQYSEKTMTEKFRKWFAKIKCITIDHKTPFNTIQNFVFCSFRKLNIHNL